MRGLLAEGAGLDVSRPQPALVPILNRDRNRAGTLSQLHQERRALRVDLAVNGGSGVAGSAIPGGPVGSNASVLATSEAVVAELVCWLHTHSNRSLRRTFAFYPLGMFLRNLIHLF